MKRDKKKYIFNKNLTEIRTVDLGNILQKELAAILNIKSGTYSTYENKIIPKDQKLIEKICNLPQLEKKINIGWLYSGVPPKYISLTIDEVIARNLYEFKGEEKRKAEQRLDDLKQKLIYCVGVFDPTKLGKAYLVQVLKYTETQIIQYLKQRQVEREKT